MFWILFEDIRIVTLSFKFWMRQHLGNGLGGFCQVTPSKNLALGIFWR